MQSINIYDYISGALKYTVPITDQCTRQAELMGEDSITLQFNYASEINLVVGDYVQYTEYGIVKNFYLRDYKDKSSFYDKKGSIYTYTITFVSALDMLSNVALFRQIEYDNQYISEYEFSLTDRLDKHAECLLQCIKNAFGEWGAYGRLTLKYMDELYSYELPAQYATIYANTEQKVIEYSGLSIKDALALLAQEYETEFWVEKTANANILHIDKCKDYPTQNVLSLSNSYNQNGTSNGLASIQYSDKEDNIGVIIPLGSDRNITRKEAVFQGVDCSFDGRLRLEPNHTYTIDNKSYTTTQGGGIKRYQDSEITSHNKSGYQRQVVEMFDDIYPHLYFKVVFTDWLQNSNYDKEIAQITIAQCDQNGNLLDNTENKIQNLVCNEGDEMKIQFESGRLRGSEFSVHLDETGSVTLLKQQGNYKYVPAFTLTILPQQDNDKVLLPTRQIPVRSGDMIGVYGIQVSELDLAEARNKLAQEAVKKIEELSNSTSEITCVTEPKYVHDNGTVIQVGTNFVESERSADIGERRISRFSYSLTNPYSVNFTATASIIQSRLSTIENKIAENNIELQRTKRKVNSMSSNSVSSFAQMDELSKMLNSLKSEMLLVGCAKWQYTTDVTFSVVGKNLEITGGVITHSQTPYKFFSYQYNGSLKVGEFIMPNFSTDNLQLDDDKAYYLYAKLVEVQDKTQDYQYLWELTDVRKSDEINTDTEYVLFGILSSVFENSRTFNQVNGFTSVVGGKITTEVLKDKDNNLIIDFVNKRIIAQNGATITGNILFEKKEDSTYLEDEVSQQSKDISITWQNGEFAKSLDICNCEEGATYRLSFSSYITDYWSIVPQEYRTHTLIVGNVDITSQISEQEAEKCIPLPIKGYFEYKEPYEVEFTAIESGKITIVFSSLFQSAYGTYSYFDNYQRSGYAELKGLTIQRKLPNSDVFESVKISEALSNIFDTTNIEGGSVLTGEILIKKNGVVIGGLSGNGRNEVNQNTQVVEGKSYFWLGSENPSIWKSPICFGEIDTSLFNYIPEKGMSCQVMYSYLSNGLVPGMLYIGQYANTSSGTPIQTSGMAGTFIGNSFRKGSSGLVQSDIVQGINCLHGNTEISIGRHLGSHAGVNEMCAVFKNAKIYFDGTSRIIGNEKIYATYPTTGTFTNDLKARMYHEILFEEGKSTTFGLYLPSTMDDTDSVEFQHIHIYTRNIGSGNYVTIYAPTSGLYQYMYMYANGTQTTKNGVKIYLDSHVHLMVRKGSNNNLIYYLMDYSNGVTLI